MLTDEYNPHWDKSPNLRDIFAMHESTLPNFLLIPENGAKYLGMDPKDYNPEKHLPLVLCAWRYQVADAMLVTRSGPSFYEKKCRGS